MNRVLASSICIVFGFVQTAWSVPYASSVSESGGTVSFILNDAADNVSVDRTGDSPLDLGALGTGNHNFSLGSASAYDIAVTNNAPTGWVQTSNDSNNLLSFELSVALR